MASGGIGIGFFELVIIGGIALALIGGAITIVVLMSSGGRKDRE